MRIEWMCTTCGKKEYKSPNGGRPSPGKCPKKKNQSHHTWVKNRTIGK